MKNLSRLLLLVPLAVAAAGCRTIAEQQEVGPDGINGCDPGIPPILIEDMDRVPIWIYGGTSDGGGASTYEATFYLPKGRDMTMQTHRVRDDGQYVSMSAPGLYRAVFVYDTSNEQMKLTLHSPTTTTTPMNVNSSPWGGDGYKAIPEIEHVTDGMDRFRIFVAGVRSRFYLADNQ